MSKRTRRAFIGTVGTAATIPAIGTVAADDDHPGRGNGRGNGQGQDGEEVSEDVTAATPAEAMSASQMEAEKEQYNAYLQDKYGPQVDLPNPDIPGELVTWMIGHTDPDWGAADHRIEIYDVDEEILGEPLYAAWHYSVGGTESHWLWSPRMTGLRNQIRLGDSNQLHYYDPDETIELSSGIEIPIELSPSFEVFGIPVSIGISTSFTLGGDSYGPYMPWTNMVEGDFCAEWDGRTTDVINYEAFSFFTGTNPWDVSAQFWQSTSRV